MKRGQYLSRIFRLRGRSLFHGTIHRHYRVIISLVTAFKSGGKRVEIDMDGRFEKVRSAMTNISGNIRWSALSAIRAMWYVTIWNLFVCCLTIAWLAQMAKFVFRGLWTGDHLGDGNFPSAEYSASILSYYQPAPHPVDDQSLV